MGSTHDKWKKAEDVTPTSTNGVQRETVDWQRRYPLLVGLEGPLAGKRFFLDQPLVSIGRAEECDVALDDTKVSRVHARIRYENIQQGAFPARCFLQDAESTNGTLLNQKKVTKDPVLLEEYDQIRIGSSLFGFLLGTGSAKGTAEPPAWPQTEETHRGLLKPEYFERALGREFSRCQRYQRPLSLALVYLANLDNLAKVAGSSIRHAGLKRFSHFLVCELRAQDVIGCLLQENTFAILMPETQLEAAMATSERLIHAWEQQDIYLEDKPVDIQLCIGVAAANWDQSSAREFMGAVENALDAAIDKGGNWVESAAG